MSNGSVTDRWTVKVIVASLSDQKTSSTGPGPLGSSKSASPPHPITGDVGCHHHLEATTAGQPSIHGVSIPSSDLGCSSQPLHLPVCSQTGKPHRISDRSNVARTGLTTPGGKQRAITLWPQAR